MADVQFNPLNLVRNGTCTTCLGFDEPLPGEPAVYITVTKPDGTVLKRIGVCKVCLATGRVVDAINALGLTINLEE